jgi:putative intracellular protease/amidase
MKKLAYLLTPVLAAAAVSCGPINEYKKIEPWTTGKVYSASVASFDPQKKNVFIIAYNAGTEIFDLMAPYYLFNLTGKANVSIVAPVMNPVNVVQGFFVMPHYTFKQVDSLGFKADVIVIPNLSAMDKNHEDSSIVNWIRKKYSSTTSLLSVCAGSFTASATGLYDGIPMTTHASDLKRNKRLYPKPSWVTGVTYTKSGNLYSTAGVSNATDGALAVIKDVFGAGMMKTVMGRVNYPHNNLNDKHHSIAFTSKNRKTVLAKVIFKNDPTIAIWLQDHIDEFTLSAILDTYHRTFPAALNTYSLEDCPVTSRFGLKIIPSGRTASINKSDEVHLVHPEQITQKENLIIESLQKVSYEDRAGRYIFDVCLDRVRSEYGEKMFTVTKRLLDYN